MTHEAVEVRFHSTLFSALDEFGGQFHVSDSLTLGINPSSHGIGCGVKGSDVSENTYISCPYWNRTTISTMSGLQSSQYTDYLDSNFFYVIMNIDVNENRYHRKKDVHSCSLDCM